MADTNEVGRVVEHPTCVLCPIEDDAYSHTTYERIPEAQTNKPSRERLLRSFVELLESDGTLSLEIPDSLTDEKIRTPCDGHEAGGRT
ncbi:hypothetical protein [Natrinema gelatinilyticum]|uniref:hypothetical protein n=1 Tax=Natrinema gelatinilyticum TaxID=2961571 RepID=UPI0020C1EF5A|nr:hypothetical protein [Natrinema gelatinilyticum]